jgi:hypothetical protein
LGTYRLESNLSKADLLLVAKLGRNKGDPIPREGNVDIPLQFLWDDSLHLYAAKLRPGLVWCGNQAGGLHGIRSFPLVNKLETDIYAIPERR